MTEIPHDLDAEKALLGACLINRSAIDGSVRILTHEDFYRPIESFLRLVAVFENWDDLRKKVARIRYANGEQGIELLNGARLKYKARTGGGGRGFAGADLVVYDEAQHLQGEHVAASGPARIANPNSQSWYSGSGGLKISALAWRLRRRALLGDAGRLAYVEHTAELIEIKDGEIECREPDLLDREAWARANAAYGRRISDESLLSLYDELGPELFARECLCIWEPDPNEQANSDIDMGRWAALEHTEDERPSPVALAFEVAPDLSWTSIGLAGRRSDGAAHLQVVETGKGTAWVTARLAALQKDWSAGPVAVDPASPAASLLPELKQAKVKFKELASRDVQRACGLMLRSINESATEGDDEISPVALHHGGQTVLNIAVRATQRQPQGKGFIWRSRDPGTDISPFQAVTLALWMLQKAKHRTGEASF